MVARYLASGVLNHALANTSFALNVGGANVYVAVHTGDPGISATANQLASTPRFPITFNAAVSATSVQGTSGSIVSSATGTITHISLWGTSDTASGQALFRGALTASKTIANVGDTIHAASAAITVTLAGS